MISCDTGVLSSVLSPLRRNDASSLFWKQNYSRTGIGYELARHQDQILNLMLSLWTPWVSGAVLCSPGCVAFKERWFWSDVGEGGGCCQDKAVHVGQGVAQIGDASQPSRCAEQQGHGTARVSMPKRTNVCLCCACTCSCPYVLERESRRHCAIWNDLVFVDTS